MKLDSILSKWKEVTLNYFLISSKSYIMCIKKEVSSLFWAPKNMLRQMAENIENVITYSRKKCNWGVWKAT